MSKLIRLTKKVPQLFTAKKIEPTLSGNNTLLVRKREFDISGIVTTRNDSSNIFKKKITEKYKKINVQSRKRIEIDKKKKLKVLKIQSQNLSLNLNLKFLLYKVQEMK